MAVEFSDDVVVPQSTGAVTTPTEPVVVEQPADPASAGAVKFDGRPVTTEFGAIGQEPTGTVETPGPETLSNVSVKVVTPPPTGQPSSTTAETAESADEETRRSRRAAQADLEAQR